MTKTNIEWTDDVWNPVTGCSKVSQGCKHCYAERMAKRLAGRYGYPEAPNQFKVTLHWDKLNEPKTWKTPRRVFVNSMSDLFHEDVPTGYILQMWEIMRAFDQHTYQILTKRAERLLEVMTIFDLNGLVAKADNIWVGVSIEDQVTADDRVAYLVNTPAKVRFLSVEPMLGPIDLGDYLKCGIHWVICGGESGPGARPMHPDWARSLRDQCQAAGVPFFFKQWGAWYPVEGVYRTMPTFTNPAHKWDDRCISVRIGKKMAGRVLDGRTWDEMPDFQPVTPLLPSRESE